MRQTNMVIAAFKEGDALCDRGECRCKGADAVSQVGVVAQYAPERMPLLCVQHRCRLLQRLGRFFEQLGALLKPSTKLEEPLECLGALHQVSRPSVLQRPLPR